jgi:cytochrome b561
MIARLLVRLRTKHPEWASTGNIWLDRLGELTHLGLYILTFGILIAGGYLAYQRGLVASVLGVGATAVTQGFRRGGAGFFIGALHGLSWNLLFLLLLLHVGAALYHQFIIKDNLLGRMWYGKMTE